MICFIIEVIVIPAKPNGPETVGEENVLGEPFVKGFPFELLPRYLPVSVWQGLPNLGWFEICFLKNISPEESGIGPCKEDVIDGFFLVLA